jgi:hypothetical protein
MPTMPHPISFLETRAQWKARLVVGGSWWSSASVVDCIYCTGWVIRPSRVRIASAFCCFTMLGAYLSCSLSPSLPVCAVVVAFSGAPPGTVPSHCTTFPDAGTGCRGDARREILYKLLSSMFGRECTPAEPLQQWSGTIKKGGEATVSLELHDRHVVLERQEKGARVCCCRTTFCAQEETYAMLLDDIEYLQTRSGYDIRAFLSSRAAGLHTLELTAGAVACEPRRLPCRRRDFRAQWYRLLAAPSRS